MSYIIFEASVTEYSCIPPIDNEINTFSIDEKSMVISFLDENEVVLTQSEISIEDAKKLARLILL